MKKILCPTDLSATSYNAITYAARLVQIFKGDLTLLNVQSLFDYTPVEFVTGKEFAMKTTTERLEAQCREVSHVFGIRCDAIVAPSYSRLSTVIRDHAQHYDLVIMGSNGADDLYQFFFGSNTYHALKRTKTPVLLIPDRHQYTPVRRVVYAFDYLRERKLPVDPLLRFTRALGSELTVLQVMEEAVSKEADEDLRELQFILKNQLEGALPVVFETIRSAHVARSIDDYIQKHQPDVLALCTRDRNVIERLFHRSIIREISGVCAYPVLVFHE